MKCVVNFTERPYLRICAKKYGYAYKKYGYAYKKYAYAYKILTLVGLFYIAFYRTCIFQYAYIRMRFFYAWQRIKYGHGMHIFQAFIKKFFAM